MAETKSVNDELRAIQTKITEETLAMYPNLKAMGDGELYTEHFSIEEIRCNCHSCKGQVPHKVQPRRLALIEFFRCELNVGFVPNSFYRCELHPKELKKDKPGEHTRGAIDVPVKGGAMRMKAVEAGVLCGATGIGVANTFVHIDFRETVAMVWKY